MQLSPVIQLGQRFQGLAGIVDNVVVENEVDSLWAAIGGVQGHALHQLTIAPPDR